MASVAATTRTALAHAPRATTALGVPRTRRVVARAHLVAGPPKVNEHVRHAHRADTAGEVHFRAGVTASVFLAASAKAVPRAALPANLGLLSADLAPRRALIVLQVDLQRYETARCIKAP